MYNIDFTRYYIGLPSVCLCMSLVTCGTWLYLQSQVDRCLLIVVKGMRLCINQSALGCSAMRKQTDIENEIIVELKNLKLQNTISA